jgi:3-dehydroquinate dehydratase-2
MWTVEAMKILVLNGPNLNMLGVREPSIYGKRSYSDLVEFIKSEAAVLGVDVCVRQSNCEGELVTWIQSALSEFDAIVINAAAYTHTSVAILDALKAVALRTVEVHLSDPASREDFRHRSYVTPAAEAVFKGRGFDSYADALRHLAKKDR